MVMGTLSAKKKEAYNGFEQGPIRPPSEANSLLIRVSRNCPWNRCRFCQVYKESTFSLRPVEHVIEDIDRIHFYVTAIRAFGSHADRIFPNDVLQSLDSDGPQDRMALNAALHWVSAGMHSIFLQDANSLIIKPERLLTILRHLQLRFPNVERITSYARSHTVARISAEDLHQMRAAGLSRIHIGMESGSDKVLAMVEKGANKKTHIIAGKKAKAAGMELSEYVMPGLGGKELSREHALETADALNQINPDFIRLRTLAIGNASLLHEDVVRGAFAKLTEVEIAEELRLFLAHLAGITSQLKSDHMLNLFEDLEGKYPEDTNRLLTMIDDFFALSEKERMVYLVGRRMGMFRGVADLANQLRRQQVEDLCRRNGVTPENVSKLLREIVKRFI